MQFSTKSGDRYDQRLSFIDRIEVLIQDFVHGEHVNFVLLKHFTHCFVADDVPSVPRVL